MNIGLRVERTDSSPEITRVSLKGSIRDIRGYDAPFACRTLYRDAVRETTRGSIVIAAQLRVYPRACHSDRVRVQTGDRRLRKAKGSAHSVLSRAHIGMHPRVAFRPRLSSRGHHHPPPALPCRSPSCIIAYRDSRRHRHCRTDSTHAMRPMHIAESRINRAGIMLFC